MFEIASNKLAQKKGNAAEKTFAVNHCDGYGERYEIAGAGARIILAPEAASSVNMAFHELATNAAKYGSLSNARSAS